MANVFTTAKPAPSAAKAKKGDDKVKIEIVGLEDYAVIDAAIKALETLKRTVRAEIDLAAKAHFIETGVALKKRPENFKGFEGISEASCELKARASTSPLSEDEQKLMEVAKLPMTTIRTVEETFIINPKYLNDGKMLERVGTAIGKLKDVPEDFIQKQEEVSKVVVAEGALDALFAKADKEVATQLLLVCGVLAVKPKVSDTKAALAMVQDILLAAAAEAE